MGAAPVDAKKRTVSSAAAPGDVADVQPQGGEPKKTVEECLEAMSQAPLRMKLSWEELRRITREP